MRNATEITPYDREERLLIISQQFGKGKGKKPLPTYEALAELCDCSVGTIYKDMRAWKESGGLELWIIDEWQSIYPVMKEEEPLEVFKILSKFLQKGMAQKITVDQRVEVGIRFTEAMKTIFVESEVEVIDSEESDQPEEPPEISVG